MKTLDVIPTGTYVKVSFDVPKNGVPVTGHDVVKSATVIETTGDIKYNLLELGEWYGVEGLERVADADAASLLAITVSDDRTDTTYSIRHDFRESLHLMDESDG